MRELTDHIVSGDHGPFACLENHDALRHLESGLAELQKRTVARIKRGVEGTHEK